MMKNNFILTTTIILIAHPVYAGSLTGPATIIDGKTIEVAGQRLQLFGIDAPQLEQTCLWPNKTIPCGKLAKWALIDLLIGATVTCTWKDKF